MPNRSPQYSPPRDLRSPRPVQPPPQDRPAAAPVAAPRSSNRSGPDARWPSDPGDASPAQAARTEPLRPVVGAAPVGRWLSWVAWFGFPRLIAAAASVVLIVVGIWWLLRAPPVPTEQLLPATPGSVPTSTLSVVSSAPVSTASSAQTVTVHVAGHVAAPGVYELAADDRVIDAVTAAGGVAADGDTESLNLAAVVVDGGRIYVPAIGEIDPANVPATPVDGSVQSVTSSGPININTADQGQLESLPGVGPATAAAIVDDRQRNGPFATVDELDRVPGIGPAKLASLRDLVTT